MSAAVVAVAVPVTALVTWALLRSPFAGRVVAAPRGDRWHDAATPLLGGVAIFAGLLAGVGAAAGIHAFHAHGELYGILGGCAVLFGAGLLDDAWSLPPIAKLGAQVGAAGVVLASGVKVEVVSNDVLAVLLAVVWLVAMTNAFNLLDNMDGLAATLGAIAAASFAVDAVTIHPNRMALVLSLALAFACVGFLPFNFRPAAPARIFMGDAGSQVLGFLLASLGLVSSWKVAGTAVATMIVPLLVLAVPILDTTLVTIVRLLEGRPIMQGGRDHTSHRLVGQGMSEKRAVVFLALASAALAATSLGYAVLGDGRLTLVGTLVTFALLVQFGSFLSQVDRSGVEVAGPPLVRTLIVHRRRLVEVVVDFALTVACFVTAYYLLIGKSDTPYVRHVATVAIGAVLFARYVAFIPFGLYRGVWRYAGARDAVSVVGAIIVSEVAAWAFVDITTVYERFPQSIFVVDALLAIVLIGASRFAERALDRGLASFRDRRNQRRTVIVGAGRHGRSLLRELRETADSGSRVIGFVDDASELRGRRLQGIPVLGTLAEIGWVLGRWDPDTVLVSIPDAPRERLDLVVEACARAQIPCTFVRREFSLERPRLRVEAGTE
jgi:UDP-GlcNAc:undecaprenyl-phosphate GlcNAc-1-phosphate transferase